MSFSNLTKSQARLCQRGKCARCGESLDIQEEFPHYLLRENCGGEDAEENCVILCAGCFSLAHNNAGFHTCYLAPLSHFPYANIYGGHHQAPVRAARTR